MESTPDRDSRQARGAWSNRRGWAILLGALILFAVAFDLLERLVGPDVRPGAEVTSDPATRLVPIRPVVTRLGRSGVRVEVEGGHRITVNFDDEAQADRVIACIEDSIATSPALTEGEAGQPPTSDGVFARNVRAKQVWNELIRIHNECTLDPIHAGESIEATSFSGNPLTPPVLPDEFRVKQEALLDEATTELERSSNDPDAIIWVGRRTAYLGRYREAIDIYTKGIELHPQDARLFRHRGHRYVTTRQLDAAIRDFERAAQLVEGKPDKVEPDGLPNDRNIPTSTLQSNIWYHLGLARYLQGDFEGALDAYRACLAVSANPDMLSATSHWLYMTLRRLGRDEQARAVLEPIHADMDIIENRDYHELLLMYRGEIDADVLWAEVSADTSGNRFPTIAYGIGNWHLANGDRERGLEIVEQVVEVEGWAAFGYIAAEAEIARRAGQE